MGNDLDLAVTLLGDGDGLAEVAGAALDLDLLVQELLEGGDIEDLVGGGLRSVDNELGRGRANVNGGCRNLERRIDAEWDGEVLTFLVILPDLPFFCDNSNRH